jgi:bZIP-type transcription factor MBZ1
MFDDNPLEPSPFVLDTSDLSTFVDFDNLSSINSSSSSSRHPSPTVPTIVEPQSDPTNLWFNFSNINDDLFNAKSTISQPITGSPWDFLIISNDSPDSGTTSISGAFSPPFTIDPQLMVTPATSKALSDFGDDDASKDEHGHDEEDEEDEEGPVTPPPMRPSKGKDRKSVVHSGGIQKKVHVSAVVKADPHDSTLDDWRPTPEEYQKMTSREKRQLRNKISARNFRNRRKGAYFLSPLGSFV